MRQFIEVLKIAGQTISHRIRHGSTDINLQQAIMNMLKFRLTWTRHDLDYIPAGDLPPIFMSARKAVELIPNQAVILSTGIAGNSRCSIYFWAIRDRFKKMSLPRDLTWITVSAVGGRGRVPGTLEELGLPGLITCHISGHLETHKALLKLGQEGELELHTMPQGVMTRIIEGQAQGKKEVLTSIGLGTFLDPGTGGSSNVISKDGKNLIRSKGAGLVYSLPAIKIAILSAPYADQNGNIYFKKAATITESMEAVAAAKANQGLVLVTVSDIIDPSPDEIVITADQIDAIVVNPRNEQTGGVLQKNYLPMFTQGAQNDIMTAYHLVKLANTITGITPIRDGIDNVIATMAASLFVREIQPGAFVNIGVGLPEEVGRILFESGFYKQLTFSTESGVYGGMPVAGMYFGASINPVKLISSAQMFRLYEKELDITVLGCLEVDSNGNVNVSRRGPLVTDYVGPGGFPDITAGAKTIIFVGTWSVGGKYQIKNGKLIIKKRGKPKFIKQVREITFNGKKAVADGKSVYYVSIVGIFKLTSNGLELISVMPGIDIKKDIINFCTADIKIPPGTVPFVNK